MLNGMQHKMDGEMDDSTMDDSVGLADQDDIEADFGDYVGAADAPAVRTKLPFPVTVEPKKIRHAGWRLGNTLYAWRTAHDMTQAELAQRVGVSRRTISGIENRQHEPVLSLGLAIAEVFGVSVHDIFRLRRPKLRF